MVPLPKKKRLWYLPDGTTTETYQPGAMSSPTDWSKTGVVKQPTQRPVEITPIPTSLPKRLTIEDTKRLSKRWDETINQFYSTSDSKERKRLGDEISILEKQLRPENLPEAPTREEQDLSVKKMELNASLQRLYPELYSIKQGEKVTAEQKEDEAIQKIYERANTDPESFMAEVISKGRSRETETLLKSFGATDDDLEQWFRQTPSEPQNLLVKALPHLVRLPSSTTKGTLEVMTKRYSDDITLLRRDLITAGRNKDTEALVKSLYPDITDSGLKDYFSNQALAIEAEQRDILKTGKGRNFTAGVGDLVANVGGIFRWAGADGIGDKISRAGQFMQVQAQPMEKGEFKWQDLFDPTSYSFQSTVAWITRATPTLMTLMIPGIGAYGMAGGIAGKLGLGALGKAVVTGIGGAALSRPIESAMEAAGAYDEARNRGLSHEDATKAANSVFKQNMSLVGLEAAQLTAAFLPTPLKGAGGIVSRGLVKAAQIGGKLAFTGLTEGGEELYQSMITKQALGEKWRMTPDEQQVFAIGAAMGLGMGGGGDILTRVTDQAVLSFNPQQKAEFDRQAATLRLQGAEEDKIDVQAVDKMVEERLLTRQQVKEAAQVVERQMTIDQLDPAKMKDEQDKQVAQDLKNLDTEGIQRLIEGEIPESAKGRAEDALKAKEVTKEKEAWQMTREEWNKLVGAELSRPDYPSGEVSPALARLEYGAGKKVGVGLPSDLIEGEVEHDDVVAKALSEGKPVPPEVLKDYPDLQKQGAATPTTGVTQPTVPTYRIQQGAGQAATPAPVTQPKPFKGVKISTTDTLLSEVSGENLNLGRVGNAPIIKQAIKVVKPTAIADDLGTVLSAMSGKIDDQITGGSTLLMSPLAGGDSQLRNLFKVDDKGLATVTDIKQIKPLPNGQSSMAMHDIVEFAPYYDFGVGKVGDARRNLVNTIRDTSDQTSQMLREEGILVDGTPGPGHWSPLRRTRSCR